jgi:hypothetical protein
VRAIPLSLARSLSCGLSKRVETSIKQATSGRSEATVILTLTVLRDYTVFNPMGLRLSPGVLVDNSRTDYCAYKNSTGTGAHSRGACGAHSGEPVEGRSVLPGDNEMQAIVT